MSTNGHNLLIISDRYPHGADSISSSFVKSQVDCLKNYFNTIYVIALVPSIPKFLSHYNFIKPRWRRDALAQDYNYENVEVYFAKHLTVPFDFSIKKSGDKALKKANSIIKNNRLEFDIIHSHFTYPSGYVGSKLKDIYQKPAVLTVHENRDWFLKEISSDNDKLLFTWKNSDKIIRVNKIDLREFTKIGIDKSKLSYIPNGYESSLFYPKDITAARERLNLRKNKIILLNIASLETYKGQKYLVEAMRDVLNVRDDVMLYIVGQGSLEKSLQSSIDKYRLSNSIILAGGNKPREEIPAWVNACDLFVLPSLSEGNPTVMFETLGCGKPFLGTDVGGIPEIITDSRLGLIVEPKDINGLSQAIFKAINTEWDREFISSYANQFTWDNIANKILVVYDELLNSK